MKSWQCIGPSHESALDAAMQPKQVYHFYAVQLLALFQGFCRDLHSECVQSIAQQVPASLRNVVSGAFRHNRRLDRGNPNPKNIADDFGRLGL